jgi:hypothetical protein
MGHIDDVNDNIHSVKDFFIKAELGSDDYNLAYKTLVKLVMELADDSWVDMKPYFHNKQELVYFTILDLLIYVDEDEPEIGESPEVVAKFLMADRELLEYCKSQVVDDDMHLRKVLRRISIPSKVDCLREAVRLATAQIG